MSSSSTTNTNTNTNDSPSTNTSTSTETMPSLRIDPSRASTLLSNLSSINSRISTTCKTHSIHKSPRLVAVSKLKPATDILALHQPPTASTSTSDSVSGSDPTPTEQTQAQLHFGENYVQELLEKSRLLPQSIRWHFIGGLQSNKCAQLAREVASLWAVESVDSAKKAQLLNKGREERNARLKETKQNNNDNNNTPLEKEKGLEQSPLRVFVQVNTSGEESKSGVEPKSDELLTLCELIRGAECASLRLQGLMTIGAIARSRATTAETENEDFVALRECRDWVVEKLGLDGKEALELSMGMSEDFEGAIVQGSDEVRVGSTIFGERPPKKEAKVLENTEEGKT